MMRDRQSCGASQRSVGNDDKGREVVLLFLALLVSMRELAGPPGGWGQWAG
jgi:hypothetical protein